MIGTFYVLADSADAVPRIAQAVDDDFRNSPYPTKTESERAFALSFIGFLGNVKALLLIISGAVTFTILLVSANTIAMSVRERVREVGVLKTLGYTPAGVEVWNAIRALDYLETRPEVDVRRIGVTGISGGGAMTWYTAAVDERISAAAPAATT